MLFAAFFKMKNVKFHLYIADKIQIRNNTLMKAVRNMILTKETFLEEISESEKFSKTFNIYSPKLQEF